MPLRPLDRMRLSNPIDARRSSGGATILAALMFAVAILLAPPALASNEKALWNALTSGGHVALLRHAIAPGTGDPREFTLGNCATQRNLSEEGRAQATRIGARFRENGVEAVRIYSSQWCRCLDTAELLELGPVTELPALNSFFRRSERRAPQTDALRDWLVRQPLDEPVVLVTHQVNITAFTDIYPASGELVVVRLSKEGEPAVVGTIETD